MLVRLKGGDGDIAAEAKACFYTESLTDCVLVSREGIHIAAHKAVVSRSPLLEQVFSATACCGGRCGGGADNTPVLFPQVSYIYLKLCLEFLYGIGVSCTLEEGPQLVRLLRDTLGVKEEVIEERLESCFDCDFCGEVVCLSEAAEHVVRRHLETPASRDVHRVTQGDNMSVRCSFARHQCELDSEPVRINNGFYNYVGSVDPSNCVMQHYKQVHFHQVLLNLQEHGITLTKEQVTDFERRLEEAEHLPVDSEDELSDEEREPTLTGNRNFTNTDEGVKYREAKVDSEDELVSRTVTTSRSSVVTKEREKKKKKRPLSGGLIENSKKPVKKRQCRVCAAKVVAYNFRRHVVMHVYDWWSETEVVRRNGPQQCPRSGCDRYYEQWKLLLVHLAAEHGELAKKMEEREESLSDYEMGPVCEGVEDERRQSLTLTTREDVRERYGTLDNDFFADLTLSSSYIKPEESTLQPAFPSTPHLSPAHSPTSVPTSAPISVPTSAPSPVQSPLVSPMSVECGLKCEEAAVTEPEEAHADVEDLLGKDDGDFSVPSDTDTEPYNGDDEMIIVDNKIECTDNLDDQG